MRVWIINPFDELPGEPGRPGRFWSLCHLLAEQGHDVTWWTADFSHRRKVRRGAEPLVEDEDLRLRDGNKMPAEIFRESANQPLAHGAPSGHALPTHSLNLNLLSSSRSASERFSIRLIPVSPYQSNVGLARLRSHRVFGRNLESALRAETAAGRRPDRIVASWPPMEGGEVAVRLGREWGVPVTIDVMDAWPEAFTAFIPGPAWVAKLLLASWRSRARAVFSAAERVSGVGRAFLDYARSLGASGPTHLTYLGAWFEVAGASCSRPQTSELEAPSTLVPLRLLYLGNIGRSQALDTVVEGVALARAQGHDVRLDIAGSGEREAELNQAIQSAGVGDVVSLHGFLSGKELEALVARAHVGVNPVRGESLIACPYKVADYLAVGLPVLNSLPGELADLLAAFGAGRSFVAGSPETFAAALAAWSRKPESLAAMARGARRLGEVWFAREKTYPALSRFMIGEKE